MGENDKYRKLLNDFITLSAKLDKNEYYRNEYKKNEAINELKIIKHELDMDFSNTNVYLTLTNGLLLVLFLGWIFTNHFIHKISYLEHLKWILSLIKSHSTICIKIPLFLFLIIFIDDLIISRDDSKKAKNVKKAIKEYTVFLKSNKNQLSPCYLEYNELNTKINQLTFQLSPNYKITSWDAKEILKTMDLNPNLSYKECFIIQKKKRELEEWKSQWEERLIEREERREYNNELKRQQLEKEKSSPLEDIFKGIAMSRGEMVNDPFEGPLFYDKNNGVLRDEYGNIRKHVQSSDNLFVQDDDGHRYSKSTIDDYKDYLNKK